MRYDIAKLTHLRSLCAELLTEEKRSVKLSESLEQEEPEGLEGRIGKEFDEKFTRKTAPSMDGKQQTYWHNATPDKIRQFLLSTVRAEVQNAVDEYDSMLFDDDSCYKTAGAWCEKRKQALERFGIGEKE